MDGAGDDDPSSDGSIGAQLHSNKNGRKKSSSGTSRKRVSSRSTTTKSTGTSRRKRGRSTTAAAAAAAAAPAAAPAAITPKTTETTRSRAPPVPKKGATIGISIKVHISLVPDRPKKSTAALKKAIPKISNNDYLTIPAGLDTGCSWMTVKSRIDRFLGGRGNPVAEQDDRCPLSGAYHVRAALINSRSRASPNTVPVSTAQDPEAVWKDAVQHKSPTVLKTGFSVDGLDEQDEDYEESINDAYEKDVDICVVCFKSTDDAEASTGTTDPAPAAGGASRSNARSGSTVDLVKIPTIIDAKLRLPITYDGVKGANRVDNKNIIGSFNINIEKYLKRSECDNDDDEEEEEEEEEEEDRLGLGLGLGGGRRGDDGGEDGGSISSLDSLSNTNTSTVRFPSLNELKVGVFKNCFGHGSSSYGDGVKLSTIGKSSQLYLIDPSFCSGEQIVSGEQFMSLVRREAHSGKKGRIVDHDGTKKLVLHIGVGRKQESEAAILKTDIAGDFNEEAVQEVLGKSPDIISTKAGPKQSHRQMSVESSGAAGKAKRLLDLSQTSSSSSMKDSMCIEHMQELVRKFTEEPALLPSDPDELPTFDLCSRMLGDDRIAMQRCGGINIKKGQYPWVGGGYVSIYRAKHPDGVVPSSGGSAGGIDGGGGGGGGGGGSACDAYFRAGANKMNKEAEEIANSEHAVYFEREGSTHSDTVHVKHCQIGSTSLRDLIIKSAGKGSAVWDVSNVTDGKVLWIKAAEGSFKCAVTDKETTTDTSVAALLNVNSQDGGKSVLLTVYDADAQPRINNNALLAQLGATTGSA